MEENATQENKITIFFLRCSGANKDLLDKCPTETSRYAGLGGVIFFTGVFAALASGYAFYTVFDNIFAAILLGLIWGTMIFNLDRYIISGMRKEHSFWRELLMALPRVLLAVIISIVIAKPLELRIFEKEIAPELVVMEQQAFLQQETEVRQRFFQQGENLRNDLKAIENTIEQKRLNRDQMVQAAQQEADGTGGSGKKNLGPIYLLKKEDANRAEAELLQLIKDLQPEKEAVEKRLVEHDSLLRAELSGLAFKKRDGPAARMEALERLADKSSAIRNASWFIMFLIIAIEITPVLIKLIAPKGPYDNLLSVEEHRFTALEIETAGTTSVGVRDALKHWPDAERNFANDRLDSALNKLS
ncbi:MAG TPA: DUF4407 domain-containing protein [Ohtaekwangia sp.]|nr:DUF4407 domain-containing protein [Ohtaekwangia sp.]